MNPLFLKNKYLHCLVCHYQFLSMMMNAHWEKQLDTFARSDKAKKCDHNFLKLLGPAV